MKTDYTYLVTFRNSTDKLTSMFTEKFNSVKDAKDAIESDAEYFLEAHRYDGDDTGTRIRQLRHWVNPKTEDYFEVRGQDGVQCVYQYFKI